LEGTGSQADVANKFAFFGPSEKHFVPEGGFCISVFAIVRKERSVLLIKPRENARWEEWAPNWRVYDPASMMAEMRKWRLPGTYVIQGEAPEAGLHRVLEDQLGVKRYSSGPPVLLNFYGLSRRYPGKMHWDYCFLFEVSTDEEVTESPWLAESTFIDPSQSRLELGSAHGEILERLASVASRSPT
jgi:ADP-ribose pyrophosphatase YjhB (NUDIX family)